MGLIRIDTLDQEKSAKGFAEVETSKTAPLKSKGCGTLRRSNGVEFWIAYAAPGHYSRPSSR
jgi:hypothetical protein